MDATVLGLGLLATIIVLMVGALHGVPRASRLVTATVHCPVINRDASAELEWDYWTVRFVDVARCSVLGGCAPTTCTRGCIRG